MRHIVLRTAQTLALAMAIGACAACGGDEKPDSSTPPAATADLVRDSNSIVVARSVQARWNTTSAGGIKELLADSPIVVIGIVEDVSFDHQPVFSQDLGSYPTVEGKPPLPPGTVPNYSTTLYKVRIESSLAGPKAPGEIVLVYQWGGDVTKADGTIERWALDGDTRLQSGEKYLLFLTQAPGRSGELVAAPWGKYRVTDRIEVLDAQWASQGVAEDLTTRAVSGVSAAIAEAQAR